MTSSLQEDKLPHCFRHSTFLKNENGVEQAGNGTLCTVPPANPQQPEGCGVSRCSWPSSFIPASRTRLFGRKTGPAILVWCFLDPTPNLPPVWVYEITQDTPVWGLRVSSTSLPKGGTEKALHALFIHSRRFRTRTSPLTICSMNSADLPSRS